MISIKIKISIFLQLALKLSTKNMKWWHFKDIYSPSLKTALLIRYSAVLHEVLLYQILWLNFYYLYASVTENFSSIAQVWEIYSRINKNPPFSVNALKTQSSFSSNSNSTFYAFCSLTHGENPSYNDIHFHTSRHWNKTYQKNILSFRECVSVRNNISNVTVNYYYFIVGNKVFGERSTPMLFHLRKAEKSGRHCVSHSRYSLNWTYFRLHFLQSTTIPLLYVVYHGSP